MIVFLQAGRENCLSQIDDAIDLLERQINIALSVAHFKYNGYTLEQWRQDLIEDLALIKQDRKSFDENSEIKHLHKFLCQIKDETKGVVNEIKFCIKNEK